jgi:stalled ribosome alternative rescue factor ArfA
MMRLPCKRRSGPARALADPRYRPKVVKPAKGKGAYTRKGGKSPPYSLGRVA